jgi:hypothetical protein
MILPAQVFQSSQLQKPVLGSQELSWRLPLSPSCVLSSDDLAQSNDVPWSSKHFQQVGKDISYCCRQCGCVIVKKGIIKTWKDLPSENWAEMMEFWHCHKPDVHEDDHDGSSDIAGGGEASQVNRGHGANTKLIAQSGICFVDLTTFLLPETDCHSLSTENNSANSASNNVSTAALSHSYSVFSCFIRLLRVSRRWSRFALALQCPGHRYNYPTLIPCFHLQLVYPLLRTMGCLLTGGPPHSDSHTMRHRKVILSQWNIQELIYLLERRILY